jgi:hypothetical protein
MLFTGSSAPLKFKFIYPFQDVTSENGSLLLPVVLVLLIGVSSTIGFSVAAQPDIVDNRPFISNDDVVPRTFFLDPSTLAIAKKAVKDNINPVVKTSLNELLLQAKSYLKNEPRSVMEKKQLPSSGDKHDFLSLAPYMWPDPNKPNGLPYIGRDGRINPEVNSIPDLHNMKNMIWKVKVLSLAYYFTDNSSYASKAAELMRFWFLNKETYMNPNLKHAEVERGKNNGTSRGIMEGVNIPDIIDSVGLIRHSHAWTKQDQQGIELWFSDYLDWLLNSNQGRDEAQKNNNHGTYFDVQVSSIALFLNKTNIARDILQENRDELISEKIQPDGRQPFELTRTNSLDYSIFNLLGLFKLASIGQHVGIDLWNYKTPQGGGLQKAMDYLLPYVLKKKSWPYMQIQPIDKARLAQLLCLAAVHYDTNESYVQAYKSISEEYIRKDIDKLAQMCDKFL